MRRFIKVNSEVKKLGRKEYRVVEAEYKQSGKDIMRKGGHFYAVLDPKTGMWSQNQSDLYRIIDEEIYEFVKNNYSQEKNGRYFDNDGNELYLKVIDNSKTKALIEFNTWFNNLSANHNFVPLDSELTFLSDEVTPEMYRSKRLPYDLVDGEIDAYNQIMNKLYSPQNREKIEWSIGAVLSGDSKKIEKFIVLYGKRGTGKSTILDLIEKIFVGYWSIFVAEELALKSHQFATAAFKDNPLVAIQDDGSLAKIDSPRINEIVSHRVTQINEKNTKQYSLRPQAMLFMATNDLVDIHDTNLGITRRLIDVYPTYETLPVKEYRRLVSQMMNFEIPAIASHCLKVYKELGKEYYAKYEPVQMIKKTNYLHNFMFENYDDLKFNDPVTRSELYKKFITYCENLGLPYPPRGIYFGEQVKDYYEKYEDTKWVNGKTWKFVFSGFKTDMFADDYKVNKKEELKDSGWLKFDCDISKFDEWCKDKGFPAQYDTRNSQYPIKAWNKVKTTMENIDSHKLHWINIPVEEHHIRIDFDIKDKDGNKDLKRNMEEANKFPPTYAEISKSGGGVHLHYFYAGDPEELYSKYAEDIEVKTDKGDLPCRRMLTKCNDIPMATLNAGALPVKEKKMLEFENVKNEKHLRKLLIKTLKKEVHPGTKPSVDFIFKILEETYQSGVCYDVSDMYQDVLAFAMNSTNHSDYCVKLVRQMHFKSDQCSEEVKVIEKEAPIIFYDVEVFPNLFLINWMYDRDNANVVRMINPTPAEVSSLMKFRLIGFNNRRYDNHMLYARMMGYSNKGLYDLSQKIVNFGSGFFREAYGLSYTDILDFSNKKQGLKKWEIELDMHHKELGLPWDKPVPEEKWELVAEYCDNDVISSRGTFHHLHEDWIARQILALLSGLTVNDTTNAHTTMIIVGRDKNPQEQFVYPDLSKEFPGYTFSDKTGSLYLGEDPKEGGYVYAEPGIHTDVALLDIASMHPTTIEILNLFGPYTKNYVALKNARLAVKHKDYVKAKEELLKINPDIGDKLDEYLTDANSKKLSYALKIPINAVYGLTAANFDNKLRDPRNVDNVVAKRGALFMINLKHEVQKRGFTVAHIKTDSIKIPNATPEIISFVMEYGKKYGYTFEHEATYKKMCLVNDAVYIAQYADGPHEYELPTGEKVMTEWTATGAEFQHPYIFKTLFSKSELNFKDYCETKSVQKGEIYLDMNENLPEDEHNYVFVGKVGSFVPMAKGGGVLYRLQNDKYYAVTGTKGYRWLEAEDVKKYHKEDDIDMNYFEKLNKDAIEHINEFAKKINSSFDIFVSDLDSYVNVPEGMDEEVPFDEDVSFMNKPE